MGVGVSGGQRTDIPGVYKRLEHGRNVMPISNARRVRLGIKIANHRNQQGLHRARNFYLWIQHGSSAGLREGVMHHVMELPQRLPFFAATQHKSLEKVSIVTQ